MFVLFASTFDELVDLGKVSSHVNQVRFLYIYPEDGTKVLCGQRAATRDQVLAFGCHIFWGHICEIHYARYPVSTYHLLVVNRFQIADVYVVHNLQLHGLVFASFESKWVIGETLRECLLPLHIGFGHMVGQIGDTVVMILGRNIF